MVLFAFSIALIIIGSIGVGAGTHTKPTTLLSFDYIDALCVLVVVDPPMRLCFTH